MNGNEIPLEKCNEVDVRKLFVFAIKNAELVGLLFDGTLDGVISDWDFNDRMNRSIVLDARYMQWQMKVVDKADRLLKEMGAK